MWTRAAAACVIGVVLSGCSSEPITQTPFQRAAGDAGSILSAAAYTIQFAHDQPAKLTVEYGQASMVNYLDQVATAPDELPMLSGAPDPASVTALVDHLNAAITDLRNACLVPDCDWQSQVQELTAASDALIEAAE